jgi:hypothetical protein
MSEVMEAIRRPIIVCALEMEMRTASHMAMAGVPLRTIGEILGHKTAAMTER